MAQVAIRTYEGYHGTSLSSAQLMANQKSFFFSIGDSEWLGDGIYFFENDFDEARDWAVDHKKYPDSVILYCTINSKKVFDLTIKANQFKLARLIQTLSVRYRNEKRKPIILDGKAINMLCSELGYDVVRAIFNFPSGLIGCIQGYTRIERSQVQLCVRSNDCLDWTSFKGWDINGKQIF